MKTFEENKKVVIESLIEMDQELAIIYGTHRNYVKHGAVNATVELQEKIKQLVIGIDSERDLFKLAFY